MKAFSGIIAAISLLSYLFIYTPLKRKTPFAVVVGGIPGALPPLIGWAAVGGSLSTEAWSLFYILFFWQIPHFLSLAWMFKDEYLQAGYKVLTTIDVTGKAASRQILIYCSVLLPASVLPTVIGLKGFTYFCGALLLSIGYLLPAIQLYRKRSLTAARRLFFFSLVFLPSLFFLLMVT